MLAKMLPILLNVSPLADALQARIALPDGLLAGCHVLQQMHLWQYDLCLGEICAQLGLLACACMDMVHWFGAK